MTETINGGCLCGNVRYETTAEPAIQLLCYCTDCQTVSGALGYAAYVVPIESLVIKQGNPAAFDVRAESGRINSRRFCPECGTRIYAQLDELGLASVNGLTLDDRDHFHPNTNHCPESAPHWCQIDKTLDTLPRETTSGGDPAPD